MEWLSENAFGIISLVFGAGGIGYAVVARVLDKGWKNKKSEMHKQKLT